METPFDKPTPRRPVRIDPADNGRIKWGSLLGGTVVAILFCAFVWGMIGLRLN